MKVTLKTKGIEFTIKDCPCLDDARGYLVSIFGIIN